MKLILVLLAGIALIGLIELLRWYKRERKFQRQFGKFIAGRKADIEPEDLQ